MAEIVRILLKAHEVVHVHELKGWTGTKDIELYAQGQGRRLRGRHHQRHQAAQPATRSGGHRAVGPAPHRVPPEQQAWWPGGPGHSDRYCLRGPSSRPVRTRSS
nr:MULTISPECIES: hypothetical protein [Streptomyces]